MGIMGQLVMASFIGCMLQHAKGSCSDLPGAPYPDGVADDRPCSSHQCPGVFYAFQTGAGSIEIGQSAQDVCASGFCISVALVGSISQCGTLGAEGPGCTTDADCSAVNVPTVGGGSSPLVCDVRVGECKFPTGFSCVNLGNPEEDASVDLCHSGTCSGHHNQVQSRCAAPTPTTAPTPAPTSAAISGDPIANVNGHKVKFELPLGVNSLLWQDDDLELFAKADVVTPDHSSQWFSDFILFSHGSKAAHIQQKLLHASAKGATNTLNSLSLMIHNYGKEGHDIAVGVQGSYEIGNGSMNVRVRRDGKKVGPLAREVVSVRSKSIDFSVGSQCAVKFARDAGKALKYAHLDINVQKMESTYVRKGIFAEFWGLIPMSAKTARMISHIEV